MCRRPWPPKNLAGIRVGGPSENEEQIREPVEVDRNERARFVDFEDGALGPPADRASNKEARRELGAAGQHERLERLELGVHLVALGLEPVDQRL